jgi:hypothetical protein
MNPFDEYHKRQRNETAWLIARWLLEAAVVLLVLSLLDWPW